MAGSKENVPNGNAGASEEAAKSPKDSGDDSDEESDILEESPCGRWQKRNDEVKQRDVPGIDIAYLAMDVEEGVEVVWNEVQFSERKDFKTQEEKIRRVFDNLIQLDHPNIVKFHKYWMDTKGDKPRVVFITEYMSSGSLKQFLKRTKRNVKKLPLQAWTRWCTQILSALSYLHLCSPPIIHGNLTCDTIFIQHTGLVKIGSVAPDAINHHVKTYREHMKHMHFVAPEYGNSDGNVTHKADIYSFGMCALETAALEIPGNGDTGTSITQETITKTLESLENPLQKEFISKCLRIEPELRPSARELLLHPILFEVHTLKLLAAHSVGPTKSMTETVDEMIEQQYGSNKVVSEIVHADGRPGVQIRMKDVPVIEKLEKFLEEVRCGIHPLTAYGNVKPTITRPASPEQDDVVKEDSPEPSEDQETRKIINLMCNVKPKSDGGGLFMTILLRLDDKMNRQLSCDVTESDSSTALSEELVKYGFINKGDEDKVASLIEDTLRNFSQAGSPSVSMRTVAPTLVNGDATS